jgi:thiol:disulfide interchange protein DsbD
LALAGAALSAQDFGSVEPVWVLSGPAAIVPGQPFEVTATVTLPAGYYQDVDSAFLSFEPESPAQVTQRSASAPTVRAGKSSYTGTFTLKRMVILPAGTSGGPSALRWKAGWQICQIDGVCLLPAERVLTLEVSVTASSSPWPGWDFWGALAAAFLGGLLLNVMPCVFPVLALKAVGLASASGLTLKERRREAVAFASGGLSTVFGLGLATAMVAAGGQRLDWGFSFQQPLFVGFLILVFWAFTLQLWGVWSWAGSPFGLTTVRRGWGRAFTGGALLVVAAAPCTAPFLGPALGFAVAQPPAWIPLFFGVLGLGLVSPLLVLQAFPAWSRLVPKPGPWMVVFERAAGVVLSVTVLYLSWVFTQQTSGDSLGPLLILLALVALVLAGVHRFTKSKFVKVGAAVLIAGAVAAAVLWVHPDRLPAQTQVQPEGWRAFSQQALDEALASGKSVLVDATAAWCATCQVNELAVLHRPDVKALFDQLGLVLLRADYTRPDPAIRDWLKSVNRAGLPVYALYRPGTAVFLFPELLTDENFTKPLGAGLHPPVSVN